LRWLPLLVVNVGGGEAAGEVTSSDQAEDGIGHLGIGHLGIRHRRADDTVAALRIAERT
jgi:hypothetical protein